MRTFHKEIWLDIPSRMHYYNINSAPTIEFMKEKSTLWKPFRTLASIYLWNLIDDGFEW